MATLGLMIFFGSVSSLCVVVVIPTEVTSATNTILVEVHCRTGFARGRFLDLRRLLELLDGCVQGIADKVTPNFSGRIGLPRPKDFHVAEYVAKKPAALS